MQVVQPSDFAAAFSKVVKKRKRQVDQFWNPWNAKSYTALFLDNDDSILRDVARRLHLKFKGPWWTLDGIFYEEVDIDFPSGWDMAKFISVAIEHENFSGRAAYQTNKLSIFNAPLKVLITYPASSGKRGQDKSQLLLNRCGDVVDGADVFRDFSRSRRQMIILGDDDVSEDNPSGTLRFRYYVYDHKTFVEVIP